MRRQGEPQLFNFSFLDILATTIGVLLFVLLLAILNQSQFTVASELEEKLKRLRQEVGDSQVQETQAKASYEAAWAKVQAARGQATGALATLAAQAKTAAQQTRNEETAREELQAAIQGLEEKRDALREKAEALAAVNPKGSALKLPKAAGGGRGQPVHVECTADGLTILGTDVAEASTQRLTCKTADIDSSQAAFMTLIRKIKGSAISTRAVLVLWVRPDGIVAANKAVGVAREAGVRLGWEPADANWAF